MINDQLIHSVVCILNGFFSPCLRVEIHNARNPLYGWGYLCSSVEPLFFISSAILLRVASMVEYYPGQAISAAIRAMMPARPRKTHQTGRLEKGPLLPKVM